MADAPERIRVAQDADGFWTCREAVRGSQEYVRADLYAALEAQLTARTGEVKVKPLDEYDYEEIINAAVINMRKAAGIRGQMITVQDGFDWWVMKETEHRILSALEAQLAERVQVKPLVWRGTEGVWAKADALFGATYRITDYAGMAKPFKLETVGFVGPNGHYGTLDEAKAAAQADFERRILSALEPAAPIVNRPTHCGGCGETDPAKRCIGCLADFGPASHAAHQQQETADENC